MQKHTNLQHHDLANGFGEGRVQEASHGFAVDADGQNVLPHSAKLLQLMDDLQQRKPLKEMSFIVMSADVRVGSSSHLSHSLAGCNVVILIIQVAEVVSSGKSLQQLSSLDVQLRQEALCT